MKALFLYTGHYGCSRSDQLMYLGVLAPNQSPIDLIKARFVYHETIKVGRYDTDALIDKVTGEERTFVDRSLGHDGETSYVILDLDKPGVFMACFETEGGAGAMGEKVNLTRGDFIN